MPQQHHIDANRAAACAVMSEDELNARLRHPRVIDGLLRDMGIDEVFAVPDADESASVEQALWDERNDGDRFE